MDDVFSIKKEQLKAVENGNGLQYILDAAYKILGNPILLHDMEYKVIEKTEMTVGDDPIWNEFESTGKVGSERLEFYKEECFFDLAANAKKITFLLSDKLKYDRIYGKIFNKDNIQIGNACIVACYKSFEEYDPVLFEFFCDILSAELGNNEFFNKYGQEYLETLVGELIEARIEDREIYAALVESIDMHLKANIYLAVVDIYKCDSENKPECVRDLFKITQPELLYSIYSEHIIIFISTNETKLRVKNVLRKLIKVFTENDMQVGISRCFDNLYELHKYYVEAVNALNYGIKTNDGERIFLFDDIPAMLVED